MEELSYETVTIEIANGSVSVKPDQVRLNINENKQIKWEFPKDNKDYHVRFPISPFKDKDFHKNHAFSGKPKKDCLEPGEKEKHFKYEVQADNLTHDPGIIIWK